MIELELWEELSDEQLEGVLGGTINTLVKPNPRDWVSNTTPIPIYPLCEVTLPDGMHVITHCPTPIYLYP